ncbi:polyketide synthase dehydratase domain-containing protein [Paenibacillus sp. ACRRX]|uniref:polyketide synthase dehydratase domain-containing protein n=1 Tax=Paenibacillus sp. ACRRX TaxID=2918206 RepID=UPI001EF57975|nr:polyketide synthase dehydratase domain-containing protein [Paenibacillus sp. ACRRX]MCG7407086.1 polyketide synthase dehydratase domain-containing protein [Paenibacillus sp. ACRRX]
MKEQFLIRMDHPIVKHHKYEGQGSLPVSSYFDLIFQLFREQGYDFTRLELRNLTVYAPFLIRNDKDVLLCIQSRETEAGSWDIRIESDEETSGKRLNKRLLLITARMYMRESLVFHERLDIARIQLETNQEERLAAYYEKCRQQNLFHEGIMLVEGIRYEGENGECCLRVVLGKEALPGAAGFMFHPALIEGAIIGSGVWFPQAMDGEQKLFIPLYCESFRAARTMDKECWIRIAKPVERKPKLHLTTLEFFASNGSKISELVHYWSTAQA